MTNSERELRALWDKLGIPKKRQEEVLASITAAAQPGAWVGPFRIPEKVYGRRDNETE